MKFLLKIIDIIFSPLTIVSALWMKFLRRRVVVYWSDNSFVSKKIFLTVGVFPIIDHYYEPLFNSKRLKYALDKDRSLPGIDMNVSEQLSFLKKFHFNEEIIKISNLPESELNFSFIKSPFGYGDAEYFYNIIRSIKPKKIIEIGSGHSSLIVQHALVNNGKENNTDLCEHICIEPFENFWLEKLPIKVLRKLVEEVDLNIFKELNENDILFIDSSHVIRPQGDVLHEILQLLPILKKGVLVHFHDIFTPKDYPSNWLIKGTLFWNEQYLLESFLSFNDSYKIIGALNYLKHHHFNELVEKCPLLSNEREPGSFWIQKIN